MHDFLWTRAAAVSAWDEGQPAQGAAGILGEHWERAVPSLEYCGKRVYCPQGQKTLPVSATGPLSAAQSGSASKPDLWGAGFFKTLGFQSQHSTQEARETVKQDRQTTYFTL